MASNNEDNHSKTKQDPKFTLKEDTQLAKSWVVTSKDAINSNQQGKDEFFACIANNYNRFTLGPPRDRNNLQRRWKNIQKFILQFAVIYNQMANNPASETSPLDWLINTKEMYLQTKNCAFTHESAWNIVKDALKWKKLIAGHAKNSARPPGRPSSHSAAKSTSAESPPLSASFQSQPNPSSTLQGADESEL
ncbi:hypothetical protein PTTG_28210 [Puccinia triticina 1-1 BBBD Race 1]|uniref:No apical meristem-associated C-terminal domain-containing protein n=1 Tax=Puccinia triticina (isolate 1-1 / race 1 (BBBD)) TaxID=630390 RepID=A0A180GDR4_PUCT1|nr:hypothetical protein PTTG_28210 [Puccinia triticina 1-1 BBBD Race 1]